MKWIFFLLFSSVAFADYSPLQRGYECVWYDVERPGELVQVYPFNGKALVSYVKVDESERDWNATVFHTFVGNRAEDHVDNIFETPSPHVLAISPGVDDQSCDVLVLERIEGGVVVDVLYLTRIAPRDPTVQCRVCKDPDFSPSSFCGE